MRRPILKYFFAALGFAFISGWLMEMPARSADKVRAVGFGAERESPSPEKLRALRRAAVAALRNYPCALPLSQKSRFFGLGARPVADPSDPAFSWRSYGCVTPTRDQKDCGSCFVFAAVASLEANWALRHNKAMIHASEQHVLNCVPGNCAKGGRLSDAMIYLVKHGTCTDAEELYLDYKEAKCAIKPVRYKAAACNYVDKGGRVPSHYQIKRALLEHGPIAAFIYAEGLDKSDYYHCADVIADSPPDDGSDEAQKYYHFVVIVGWDDNKAYPGGKGAWEIKNSWGKKWGRNGFADVAYNVRSIGDNAMWIEISPGLQSKDFILQSRVGLTNSGR